LAKKPAKPVKATKAAKKAPSAAARNRSTTARSAAPTRKPTAAKKPVVRSAKPAPAPAKRKPVAAAKPARPAKAARPAPRIKPAPAPVIEVDGDEAELKLEPALTAAEIEQFRHMLLEKRAEIRGDVHALHSEALNKDRREAAGDLSSMPIHMADLGTDNYELEFTLGLIEGERAILREIEEALERIREGTYGVCLATGKPIGKARLKAKPWAKYCYEYTLAQEQGQRRF
jgi:DnaK suppressor protein